MRKLVAEPKKLLANSLQARAKRSLSGKRRIAYLDPNGNLLSSTLELSVAKILHFAGVEYSYKLPVPFGSEQLTPTFTIKNGYIVVDSNEDDKKLVEELRKAFPKKQVLYVTKATMSSTLSEIGSPIASALVDSETSADRLQSIFVDDPSFAFDYSHILPWTKKCSVLHGHTSAVMIELIGQPEKGMIVDFGDVKNIVKESLGQMDHKLFISRKYMAGQDSKRYWIRFNGPNGDFDLKVPKTSTFLLEGEATIENLADAVLKILAPKMPPQVQALGVYIYEGLNKGSHLIASLTKENQQ